MGLPTTGTASITSPVARNGRATTPQPLRVSGSATARSSAARGSLTAPGPSWQAFGPARSVPG